ncbi:hypothetical protein HYU22_02320 [Candidatus Woesearchaeota archaeon]|nr:hypothetical protein [Candidatus Woesearchaeota archaeon]
MNSYFIHALKHQRAYLILLLIVMLLVPILSALYQHVPLGKGGESYYHLSQAQTISWSTFYYFPLWLLQHSLPGSALLVIPPLLALVSLFLFLRLARQLNFPPKHVFFFGVFFIISPTFIWAYTTFSAFSYFLFLLLLGFTLFMEQRKALHYLSLVPFLLATFFDVLSTVVLLVLFGYLVLYHHKRYSLLPYALLPVSLLVNILILRQPLVLGPFQAPEALASLIADFGGMAGVSFFLLLMAVIGLVRRWRHFSALSVLLLVLISAYIYDTQMVGFLALPITFFAAAGFVFLLERPWTLENLKWFTLLLLVLGLFFSTASYLNRIPLTSPTMGDLQALHWINGNVPTGSIIFSDIDNGYFIHYFAQRQPLYAAGQGGSREDQDAIFNAIYIDQLFPLLEKNTIHYIYINPTMRAHLPRDYGLLFLLKNERFKLLYSHEGYELWEFV